MFPRVVWQIAQDIRHPDANVSAEPAIKLCQNASEINHDWALFDGSYPASPKQRNVWSPTPEMTALHKQTLGLAALLKAEYFTLSRPSSHYFTLKGEDLRIQRIMTLEVWATKLIPSETDGGT